MELDGWVAECSFCCNIVTKVVCESCKSSLWLWNVLKLYYTALYWKSDRDCDRNDDNDYTVYILRRGCSEMLNGGILLSGVKCRISDKMYQYVILKRLVEVLQIRCLWEGYWKVEKCMTGQIWTWKQKERIYRIVRRNTSITDKIWIEFGKVTTWCHCILE